jgi:serine/threonine-protein kinase
MVVADRYIVGAHLADGGFGVVYRAKDGDTGKDVVLKALHPEAFVDPNLVERFEQEAEIVRHLRHPNTAAFLGSGRLRGADGETPVPYMVFALVRGVPLGDLMAARGSLSPEETGRTLAQVCDALQEAHLLGVVHRDLKPNNLLVEAPRASWRAPRYEGTLAEKLGVPELGDAAWRDIQGHPVKVVDFGLGKLVRDTGVRRVRPPTAAGFLAGTPHFASPEQARGARELDHRSDLYSVAMLVFRLLTGEAPYQGRTVEDIAVQHVSAPLPPLPPPFDAHPLAVVYGQGGSKDPDQRYSSAAEMAWALRAAVDPVLGKSAALDAPPVNSQTAARTSWLDALLLRR